jgi:hypothetical protein
MTTRTIAELRRMWTSPREPGAAPFTPEEREIIQRFNSEPTPEARKQAWAEAIRAEQEQQQQRASQSEPKESKPDAPTSKRTADELLALLEAAQDRGAFWKTLTSEENAALKRALQQREAEIAREWREDCETRYNYNPERGNGEGNPRQDRQHDPPKRPAPQLENFGRRCLRTNIKEAARQDRARWMWQLYNAGRHELTSGDIHVGLAVASHINWETGTCFPSEEQLARDTGKKRNTVRVSLSRLERFGHLRIERRGERDGRNIFIPLLNSTAPEQQPEQEASSPRATARRAQAARPAAASRSTNRERSRPATPTKAAPNNKTRRNPDDATDSLAYAKAQQDEAPADGPTNPEQYAAHFKTWLSTITDVDSLRQHWNQEGNLRKACAIPDELKQRLRAEAIAKGNELVRKAQELRDDIPF